ncbi:heptosyltransferase-3 [Oxalobacteraceae bacterium GrIS 2.11]
MPIIPTTRLAEAKKVLFITHLAIGDFTYLQNFFAAFAKQNPQLKIDIWIDELRRSSAPKEWEFLKKYALYDWAENCPFFRKVYRRTYSPDLLAASITEAQQEDYPIVISLATLRPYLYANLARTIGPNAFVVGIKGKSRWYAPWDRAAYAKLDQSFAPFHRPSDGYHITAVYADWFAQLSDLHLTQEQRFPFIDIPTKWQDYAQGQLNEWGATHKVVFINAYAKTKKRCWPLASVAELVVAMRALPAWQDSCFVINAVPQELENARQVLSAYQLTNTHLFSANENFYQLPALLSRCDLIISVETAVMHLANAVHVPVIALMRQKNPEWVPIDQSISTVITTERRSEWVSAIKPEQVIKAIP